MYVARFFLFRMYFPRTYSVRPVLAEAKAVVLICDELRPRTARRKKRMMSDALVMSSVDVSPGMSEIFAPFAVQVTSPAGV